MQLPDAIAQAAAPVFEALPLDQAMPDLVPSAAAGSPVVDAVQAAVAHPALADHPELQAGLWLYADDLDASHTISQSIDTPTGSYWHAIMHRREGDFGNCKYWYRLAGDHPVLAEISPGFDPDAFVDDVQRTANAPTAELLDLQRREWTALFQWCANQDAGG
ncbi:MAG: hypothetical protein AAF797_13050 [Planctomycetota bacterium]